MSVMKLNGRELVLPGVVKGDVSAAHALRARLDEAARRGRIDVPLADQVCQPVQLLPVLVHGLGELVHVPPCWRQLASEAQRSPALRCQHRPRHRSQASFLQGAEAVAREFLLENAGVALRKLARQQHVHQLESCVVHEGVGADFEAQRVAPLQRNVDAPDFADGDLLYEGRLRDGARPQVCVQPVFDFSSEGGHARELVLRLGEDGAKLRHRG
mmetsp:Transcript_17564/g.42622  ORF Transcript_17564/g.42622 Transcript_17564/m.42622 type:complete len:214 (-) Transcript_17564:1192-1833(-)